MACKTWGDPFQHEIVISIAKLNCKTVTATNTLSDWVMLPGQVFMNLSNNRGPQKFYSRYECRY